MMTNRVCYNCAYIEGDRGWGGSDVTPGYSMSLYCTKGHWDFSEKMYGDEFIPTLKECLEHAASCPDFITEEHKNETDTLIQKQRSEAFHKKVTVCNSCGSHLHTYKGYFTHCPACSPVDEVSVDGVIIQPTEVR